MNWKKLETFKKIAKFRSFNIASKELKKSQSTFSRDIISLENDLGFKVFDRNMRSGIKLTEKGKDLLKIVDDFSSNLALFKN